MSVYKAKMRLTDEEKAILEGKEGPTKAKMMEVLVRYGDTFNAECMEKVTHKQAHFVTSFGLSMIKPVYPLINSSIKGYTGLIIESPNEVTK